MYRLKKQIDYAKFTENSIVTLDIDYAERLLLELTEQYESPTLEEVKKEWEKLGYEFELYSHSIQLINSSKNNEIIIWLNNPRFYDCGNSISLKEHQLLTKTFKALGWL